MELKAIHYAKPNMVNLEELQKQNEESEYNPFEISELQFYNPLYQRFFEMNENNYQKIALNHPYHIRDLQHVEHLETKEILEKPVFVKFSPLLDPYRYMIGKYKLEDNNIATIPKLNSTPEEVHPKMLFPHNTSYVDCFFTYLSSCLLHQKNFEHGIDFYGSFLGIQKVHKVCVTDDVEYLHQSEFYNKHVGELFYVDQPEMIEGDEISILGGSRKNRKKLCLEEETIFQFDDFQELEASHELCQTMLAEIQDLETIYSKSNCSASSSRSSSDTSNDSELNYSSEEDEEDDQESMSDESGSSEESECSSEEEEIYGYIHNFPIQMICMEKCDGTLDSLLENDELEEDSGCAMLIQIIMMLLTYQKHFQFTHNDLHTNNVMYVKTEKPFLYYEHENKTYKVPTYGRIYKLIDFGRAIYKYDNKVFCSDSFGPGGDASTQYNCEPFFNENKPRLEPNFAFDLCRLGTSIYDFMMDIEDDISTYDEFQKIIYEWCLDDNGKNVLYKKNGEERYPCFKLYKMIARTAHYHTPEAQLERSIFSQYVIEEEMKEKTELFSI
jgi:hypothetical protein